MNAVASDQVERYLAAVRAALTDIGEEEREELLEDLPQHFAEVAAESSAPLSERLGPPEAYAAELRAAAGIASRSPFARWGTRNAAAVEWLVRFDELLGRVLGYPRLRDFLVLLRPAWWVLRGYVVGMAIARILYAHGGLLPGAEETVLVLPVIAGSVWLGRRASSERWQERLVWWVVNAMTALLLLIGLTSLDSRINTDYYGGPPSYTPPAYEVVYPLDESGRPLTGVRLYDANGNPVPVGTLPPCGLHAPEQLRSPLCYLPPAAGPSSAPASPSPSGSAGPSPSGSAGPSPGPS